MQYKTIVLELVRQNPTLHHRLRLQRRLMTAVDELARQFQATHQEHFQALGQADPNTPADRAIRQTFETALAEMQERLSPASFTAEDEAALLDNAMAYVLSHSPRG